MKIAKLLEVHNQFSHSDALQNSFGDAYLLQHNQIYRNIRKAALNRGFAFSSAPNPAYQALPFAQLESILKSKVIPYIDNVSVLKSLPESLSWEDVGVDLRKNYAFHEACHAVARTSFGANRSLMQIMMEESFSNTCELLAVVDAEDAAHRIFYETNSYSALFEARFNLKNAMADLGKEFFFKFIFLCYLHSNHLRISLEGVDLDKMAELAGGKISPQNSKALKALSKIPFTLDLRFRTVITQFHLKICGLQYTVQDLPRIQIISGIEKNNFLSSLDSLVKLTLL